MNEFIGAFFHSFYDTRWQGQVLGPVAESGNYWYVQTFNWADGASATRHVVSVHALSDWTFYGTRAQMEAAFDEAKDRWDAQERQYGQ